MPRLKLRKLLFTLTVVVFTVIIFIQIQLSVIGGYTGLAQDQLIGNDTVTYDLEYIMTLKTPPAEQKMLLQAEVTKTKREEKKLLDMDVEFWPSRMWFFKNGTNRPNITKYKQYPSLLLSDYRKKIQTEDGRDGDRIVSQMNYVPPTYSNTTRIKTILMDSGLTGWGGIPLGRKTFNKISKCPVDTCTLVIDKKKYSKTADAILFKHFFPAQHINKPAHQVWILYLLESPKNTPDYRKIKPHSINWTASYRHDSDIVTPYEKFEPYDDHDPKKMAAQRYNKAHNWARNKTKKVAWFVSNCYPQYRLDYARELSKHIQVDVYGLCGTEHCLRDSSNECFHLLNRDYKFYLAFENSHCQDYITEKFFLNGLSNKIVPIVMGARPEDYRRQAPPKSYLHVEEFKSPKHLAEYLHILDKDDRKYSEYFQWKGTGEFINTYFWCRLCAMLHAPREHLPQRTHQDIQTWWRGDDVCVEKNQLRQNSGTNNQQIKALDSNTKNKS